MQENTALISVILPVYNREKCVATAIESIVHQSYANWELIIVDDGSTDDSYRICESYCRQDQRIKLEHTANFGVSHARNVGLDRAKGEWIVFIDSDDTYVENALETMLAASDGVSVVMGATRILPSYHIRAIPSLEEVAFSSCSQYSDIAYLNGLYYAVWAKMFQRLTVSDIRFDETIRCDEDQIYMRDVLSKKVSLRYIPVILYHQNKGTDNSLSKWFHLSRLLSRKKVFDMDIRLFTSVETQKRVKDHYVFSAITFFHSLVWDNKEKLVYLPFIVQAQLDENISTVSHLLKAEDAPPRHREIWEIILTGDAEKVIAWYQENGETMFRNDQNLKEVQQTNPDYPTKSFIIRIADICVKVYHEYDLIREKCKDYLISDDCHPDLEVYAPEENRLSAIGYRLQHDNESIADDYAEYDALPYRFYGDLPKFDAFWLHSVVIEKDGVAYAFSAQPGTGKSTHAALWLKAFPDAHIINGDNAIVRFHAEDGQFYAYGTPFCGKEGYQENRGVPLKGICFLQRGAENEIHRIGPDGALIRLLSDNFCIQPQDNGAHYYLYKKLLQTIPVYSLSCNMDIEAARVAYTGLRLAGDKVE